MTKRMLIDATHPEETRVAVISGNKLEEYDYETVMRKQLKGNIYLVKVTRVEPSLQAAFVDFGGNRHGFLPFPEIHPDYYRIPIADREALLAEERELAAEQAAREDEEDAAELAAQGHSLDDFDDEDEDAEGEEGHEPPRNNVEQVGETPEEDYVPRHTGSLAADITQESVIDDSDDEDETDASREEDDAQVEAHANEAHAHENHAHEAAPAQEAGDHAQEEHAEGAEDAAEGEANEGETAEAGNDAGEQPQRQGRDRNRGRHRGGRHGGGRGRHQGQNQSHDGEGESHEAGVESVGGDVVEPSLYRSSIKRRYKIQEVIKRNQIMLIQISKEERGNKGAAVTSYISLPGRYCVLMPNSPRGGGVSRKVSNAKDRQRLKKILHELNVPEGMSVILRTAGVARSKAEIKRDLDYLLRLWDQIREYTLKSQAPALIYEEGNLIKRAIRDLYRRDIDEVHVAGEAAYNGARDFMTTLMPSHAERVQHYKEENVPLFFRYQVESQIDEIHNPTVHLKSGGYIVINPTEAMVSVDVNSGKATKGRHIEETALKTNIEAADEIARQLRLRDQGGLIVIDFIDMEDKRNNRIVERRMRDAMATDRARIQLGRISAFGLLELSRQRLHPSLVETNFEVCKHCQGSGLVRTVETTAVMILRALEEEGLRGRAAEVRVNLPGEIALYIFNQKREHLANIERRYNIRVELHADESLLKPAYNLEVTKTAGQQIRDNRPQHPKHVQTVDMSDLPALTADEITDHSTISEDDGEDGRSRMREEGDETGGERQSRGDRNERHGGGRDRNRGGRDRNDRGGDRNRGGRDRSDRNNDRSGPRPERHDNRPQPQAISAEFADGEQPAYVEGAVVGDQTPAQGLDNSERGGRRRGRRGGRRRGGRKGDRPFDRNRPEGAEGAPAEGQGFDIEAGADNNNADFQQAEGAAPEAADGGENNNAEGQNRGGRDRNRGGRNRGGRDRNDRGPRERSPQNGEGSTAQAEGQQQRHENQNPSMNPANQTGSDAGNDSGGEQDGGEAGDGKSRKGWWKRLTE